MSILYITYALDGLLTIILPIALAVYITRRYQLYWSLFWYGAAVYAVAEIVLGLLNNYVVYPFLATFNLSATVSTISSLVWAHFSSA